MMTKCSARRANGSKNLVLTNRQGRPRTAFHQGFSAKNFSWISLVIPLVSVTEYYAPSISSQIGVISVLQQVGPQGVI